MAENTPNGSSKAQELYNFLTQVRKEEGNLPLLDKSEVGKDANDFANKLQDQNFSKTIFEFLTIPKPEEGNIPLLDKSEIGNDINGFLKTFVPQKKNPIGFESSNGSAPSPLASSMYAPMQGMGEKVEKQVKNAPLVSSKYAPVAGMGMAPTGGVAEFGKYLYNKLLSGTGGVAAGTTDFITQAATPAYIPKESTAIVVRNTITPYLRNFLGENIGAKQSKEQKKIYDDDFITGSIGGLAESVPAMLTGVPGLFAQAYDSSLQSINNSKFANDLSETEKSMFALSVGGVSSILEKYGLDKIFTKSKAFNAFSDKLTGLIIDRLASQGVKITSKILSQEASNVVNNITKKAIKSGIRITDASLVEGLTGGSQEVATIGLEEVFNKYKGKEIFDNGSMGSMMGRVLKAAGQEAIGGGIMGGFASIISGDLTDKRTLTSAASAPNNSETIPVIVDEINRQVESNQITQDEADQALGYLNLSATNNTKIPDNISNENRNEALEILNEKTELEGLLAQREAAAANLDPAFKDTKATEIADIKAQIEEKNQLLKSIGNGEAPIIETTKPTEDATGTVTPQVTQEKIKEVLDKVLDTDEDVAYNIEGEANIYTNKLIGEKLTGIIDKLNLSQNIKDIIKEHFSITKDGEFFSSLGADKVIKTIDISRSKAFVKKVGVEIIKTQYDEYTKEFSNAVDKLNNDINNYFNEVLDAEASGADVVPSKNISKVLGILNQIRDFYIEEESNIPNTPFEVYLKAKEDGLNPKYVKLVESLITKPTEDATKISKEPITQGGEQGDIVQREGTQEGQPQAGQGEGGTGETTQPEADNSNRPISSEEGEKEVIQESKQEPIKKRAFIDIQEIEDKYPNLYKSLQDGTLKYPTANKYTILDIKNLLVRSSQIFFEDAGSATDYLDTLIDIENIIETLYEPLADNVTKEEFKQRLVESNDFTKKELGIFNALIDTLDVDQMPTYILDQAYIKRQGGKAKSNFYVFARNLIVSKDAQAFVHEIGHFAYFNILSKEDRINYLKYMISTTYDTPNSKGKSIKSRLAYTSEKITFEKNGQRYTVNTNVGDEFSEYFAEQFSQWYLNKKVFPKDIEYIFRKVKYMFSKVIEKLISGKYVDENLSDYFNKIIGEVDKISKENKPIGEAKVKPEVPTELTKLEEKYNKDKKSLTKKELNDVLEIKRERRKKAMASIEKGNLSEEEVAIKKAAMQKLTDTMVEIIALIDKGKFKKVEADKEPTIKQKIKAGTEGGTTKTKAMTFSEYMRDRKRSFEEGYKKGTKDRAAQEQYRRAMLNVAIEYLVSKKLGKLKEAALRSLIMAASKVSNMSKLETFIKRVDLIMAKADFIEKYKEAKTLKKELDTNKKGGATQLIQRLKNINLDYLPESGIDKVIAIAKELNSKRPDMSTVIPNMKEVLDLEEAGFREAMRANYGELGLLGGSISKFMDNEEIYKNLKKLIEYQLISKEQVAEVELENAKTVLKNKLEEAYKKIKDFVDNKKTIDNLGEYLDIKKAIKAYNRTVRQIDQVMPEFAQKFELLTDADNEISQRLGKEIEAALKEFKEKVIKVSLNTSANLREYALSDAFKEESGLSPELNEILSNHLANFANNMDRETMNDLSVEDIADYTFFAEQALLGYISPEIYETYSKVGAIKAKNDTMQDLASVMESDSKLQKDIAKINANYKGAKKTEDFVRIMTEYRKHNVDSFLGSGAVSLFYNNVYFPFGTNVTRMRAIIADLTTDFLKLDDDINNISLGYGIPKTKILGGKKVIVKTTIGKLLGSDKSMEDVKNTIMILLQQLDFITNLENPDKAKEKVYFDSFINNKEKRDAFVNAAKDKQGMRDLFKKYENAIEIISKLQGSIKDKNKTLSDKAAGLITGKSAETLSKTTEAGVTLETISGVEEILNELASSNPVIKAYIEVIRKTIASFEAYTEMNTMMKGEQYYSLPNYMVRQYVSGNLNTVSTSDKTAQLLSGKELYQRIKKNSSATYSREGDGLKPRIIDPKASLMMHANDVMMEYSLKGIMEASLEGITLAEQQAKTQGEKDFLVACKESMNLMLETEFVTSKTDAATQMTLDILNLQTTLLVGNALRQPADYGGNLLKVGTSVDGAKVFIKNIAEKLGTLQFLENGNSNLKELQERDKAAYELASMLGGEFLWSETEKKASQTSGNIGGEQVMGNKTIKLAWADRLIVSNVYLPLFIKYFEQSSKKKFDPKEFNENPQKYYLDNLKALQTATKEADRFIAKTHVSKNPLTKPEIVSLLGMKLKRDAIYTRLLFSLTGYNANDSEVIKAIAMDLYYGNGDRGLKLAQLAGRVSRSAASNVAYMAAYKVIFGTLSVLIQSSIGFFDDDDDKEFAKVLVKEWDEFYQQYLTRQGLQQDLLGSLATMLTGKYQNIVRPIVNVSLFAAMKAGLLGEKTKMSEDKYKKIIRSTRSANFFTKQYAPKYDIPMVLTSELVSLTGLSYVGSMAAENAMTLGKAIDKGISSTDKNTDIDFIAATTAGLQLANASAMLMGGGYAWQGTYNKVSDQVKRVVREEQRKQKPANVQSIQSVLRAKPAMKKYNPLKP
jgi:hypothetical protein